MKTYKTSILWLLMSIFLGVSACSQMQTTTLCNPNRLLFVSDRNGNDDIFVMDMDGSDVLQLTDNPANDTDPQWSPDHCQIAFVSMRDDNPNIFVMNAEDLQNVSDDNVNRLTDGLGDDFNPVWSPDGQQIAFEGKAADALSSAIYLVNHDGSDLRPLTDVSLALEDFCNNQEFMEAAAEQGIDSATCIQEMDTLPFYAHTPAWSPDGKKMAFVTGPCTGDIICNYGVYVINVDGTQPTRVSKNTAFYQLDIFPYWEKDNKYLDFVCTQLSEAVVCTAEFASGRWTLTEGAIQFSGLGEDGSWGPDGAQFAFSSLGDIYLLYKGGGAQVNLTDNGLQRNDFGPIWLSEEQIAFISDRDGNNEIYLIHPDGTGLTRLTNHPSNDRLR